MPNPRLNKLHQFLNTEDPELVSGMQENEFVTKFSNPEKLQKLYSLLEENNPDLLGGMSSDEFETKFGESKTSQTEPIQSSAPRIGISSPKTLQTKAQQHFEGQMQAMVEAPRVGVTAPNKLQNEAQVEKVDINKPITTSSENTRTTIVNPELEKNPFEVTDLSQQHPIDYGLSKIGNKDEILKHGNKENVERTKWELGNQALEKSMNARTVNLQAVNAKIARHRGDVDISRNSTALDDYLADIEVLNRVMKNEDQNKLYTPEYQKKTLEGFENKWKSVIEDKELQKTLEGTIDFQNKILESKDELIKSTPNHQKYLQENKKIQQEEDKLNFANPFNWGKALENKINRVVIGSVGEDISAAAETYLGIGHGSREYFRQLQEKNPSTSRHDRNMIEDYVEDPDQPLDYVLNDKNELQYVVDRQTGNKVDLLVSEKELNTINEAVNGGRKKDRYVWNAIMSQGFDEAWQELLGIAVSVFSSGVGGAMLKGIKGANTTSKTRKLLKSINDSRLGMMASGNSKTIKKIAETSVEFASGSLEGMASARDEALRQGLSGSEVTAYVTANQTATGIGDAINPMEIAWRNNPASIAFKNKIGKYASKQISKTDLLKETGASFLLDFGKNQGKEFVSEAFVEPIVRNKLKDVSDNHTSVSTEREAIDSKSIQTAFLGSIMSSGAFSVPTSLRYSKDNLMGQAIKYAVANPDFAEGVYQGMIKAGPEHVDRAEFFKSTMDQIQESGINEDKKAEAAVLIIDRQNAALQVAELSNKYGKDAPLVKRQKIELEGIEKKLDELFLNEDIPAEAGTEDATLGETPTPKDDKGENGVSAMAETSEIKLKEGDQFLDKNGVEWTVGKNDEVTAKIDGGVQGTTIDSFDPKEIELINKTSINEGDQVLYNGNPHTVHGVHKTATGSNAFSLKDEKGNIVQSENGKISYVNEGSLERAEKEAAPIQGELDSSPVSKQTEEATIGGAENLTEGSTISQFKVGDVIERSGKKYKVLGNSKGNNEGTVKLEAISDDPMINGRKSEWNAENNGGFNLVGEIKGQAESNPKLKDIESTAKALDGINLVLNTEIKGLSVRMSDLRIAEDNLKQGKKSITPNEPVDVTINITTGERELSDGYHRYLDARGGSIENAKVNNLEGSLPAKIKFEVNEKIDGFVKAREATNKEISEAYHKAKSDGSNPELVKAVESLLSKEQQPSVNKGSQQRGNPALSSVESTAKALEGIDTKGKVPLSLEYAETDKKAIAEAYHADRAAGKETELTKAVEELLGKPTEKPKTETTPTVSSEVVSGSALKDVVRQESDAEKLNKEAGVDIYVARQDIDTNGGKYTLSQIKENGNTNTFLIEDAKGNEVGKAQLSANGNYLENIRIDEKHRRKGLASKVYDFIELRKGIELEPSPNKQSKEAKALWDKRNLQKSVSNKANGGLLAKALGESMSKTFADFRNKQQVLLELENKYFEQKGLSKEEFNKLSENEKSEIIKDAIKWKNDNPELVKAVESLLSKEQQDTAKSEQHDTSNQSESTPVLKNVESSAKTQNFTQFAIENGYPDDYDTSFQAQLLGGRGLEGKRQSNRSIKEQDDAFQEMLNKKAEGKKAYEKAILEGKVIDPDGKLTRESILKRDYDFAKKELESKISNAESGIKNIEGLGKMSHLDNGKLKKGYQRAVDDYKETISKHKESLINLKNEFDKALESKNEIKSTKPVPSQPVKQQKSKSEIVKEINSKNLSHVRGLSMGENQSTGTYISTEKKNRYETEDKKAEKVKVDIKDPYVVEDDPGMISYRNELLNESVEQFDANDFEGFEKPNRSNLNIEDLNADGIKKLAKLVAEKLQSEGYDSIYFPESKTQEGELIVFDRNFVIITDDIQETELTFNKDKKDGFISQSGRQSIIFAYGELKVVDVKTGKEVSREVRNKVIGEYTEKFNFHYGESGETNDFEGNIKQYKESVLENSSNPYEILNLYIKEPFEPIALSAKETVIANGQNFNTTGKSFNQFGDKNKMTMSIAKSYMSGQPKFSLDQIAAYLSEDGMQIEPEDLVEFMLRFPNGTQQALRKKETSFAQEAASKFKKLTGIEITPKNAETLLKKIDKQTEFIINENDWRREVEKIRNERSFYKNFYGGQGKSEEGDGSISKGTGGGGQGARDVEKGKISEQGKDRNESDRTRTDEVGAARGRARESSEGSSGEVRGVQEASTQIVEDIPVQDSKKGQSTSDDARNIKKSSTKKVEKKIEEQIVSDELDWFSDDKIEAIEEIAEPNENKKNCK